jgi:hypothetical protein
MKSTENQKRLDLTVWGSPRQHSSTIFLHHLELTGLTTIATGKCQVRFRKRTAARVSYEECCKYQVRFRKKTSARVSCEERREKKLAQDGRRSAHLE